MGLGHTSRISAREAYEKHGEPHYARQEYDSARSAEEAGDREGAIRWLRVALKKDPSTGSIVACDPAFEAAWSDTEFLILLLSAVHQIALAGEPGKAIQVLDAVIARDSVNPFNYYRRSHFKFVAGDREGAFSDLATAISMRPSLGPKARTDVLFRDMCGDAEFVKLTHQDA